MDLHEHGIAYRTARGVRRWTWDRITAIHVREREDVNRLAVELGTYYWCAVGIDGKRRLVVTGLTREHDELVRAPARQRPDVYGPELANPVVRLRWWWLGAGLVFLAGLAAAVLFPATHPDTAVQVTNGNRTEITDVPAISKDDQPYVFGAMAVCLILGTSGIRLFRYATRERR